MNTPLAAALAVTVGNPIDTPPTAAIVLGAEPNRLIVTLRCRAAQGVALDPGTDGATGGVIEVALAADVPAIATARASVASILASGGGGAAPLDAHYSEDARAFLVTARAPFTLAQDDALAITLDGIVVADDYAHVPMLLTVAWRNVRLIDAAGGGAIVPDDGRALTLDPRRSPARGTASAAAPISLGWLADLGDRTLPDAALGLVMVSPRPIPPEPDPMFRRAQDAATAAAAAEAALAGTDGHPDHADLVDKAQAAGRLARAAAALAARTWVPDAPPAPPPIVNRLAFRLQNSGAAPLFAPDDSGARPSFTIGVVTAESEDAAWRYDALCTVEQAGDIQCRVFGDDHEEWTIAQDRGRAQWTLTPRSADALGARESIVIVMDNVVTSMPAFPTGVYVAHRGLPGYEDGVTLLPLEKVDPWPTIASFTASVDGRPLPPGQPLTLGQQVTLDWHCWGAPPGYELAVSLTTEVPTPDGLPVVTMLKRAPPDAGTMQPLVGRVTHAPIASPTTYRLSLRVPNAPPDAYVQIELERVVAQIAASDGLIDQGQSVTLAYRTPGASDSVIGTADGRYRKTVDPGYGSVTVTPPQTMAFSVTANGYAGPEQDGVLVQVRDVAVPDRVVYVTSNGLFDAMAAPVDDPGGYRANGNAFTGDRYLWDFGGSGPFFYLMGAADDPGGRSLVPMPLPPIYDSDDHTQFEPRQVVSLLANGDAPFAATYRARDGSGQGQIMSLAGDVPAPIDLWMAPANSNVILMRYSPVHRLLFLSSTGTLIKNMGNGFGIPIAEHVASFAIGDGASIYWVDSQNQLLRSDGGANGATWTPEKLVDLPGISTRIVHAGESIYWAENAGEFGPVSRCWSPAGGVRTIRMLPNAVPFNGVTAAGGLRPGVLNGDPAGDPRVATS